VQRATFAITVSLLIIILASCAGLPATKPTEVVSIATETLLPHAAATPAIDAATISSAGTSNSVSPTSQPLPTLTPIPTATSTPIEYSFSQIRPVPDGDTNTIWTAFWQEDENSIYYAVIKGDNYENLAWGVADIRDAPSIKEKQL
jgi:hypothetical protein